MAFFSWAPLSFIPCLLYSVHLLQLEWWNNLCLILTLCHRTPKIHQPCPWQVYGVSQHIIPKDRECFLWNTSQHFPSLQSPEIFPSLISSQLKEIQREKETRKETWVTSLDPCGWECISVCVWSLWGLRVEVVYGLCKSKNSQGSGNF